VGPDERAVATIAKERFVELLGSGSLDLTEVRCSCSTKKLRDGTCNHHRKCAILSLNGKNIGDTLIGGIGGALCLLCDEVPSDAGLAAHP
jgi:hypothetical protein